MQAPTRNPRGAVGLRPSKVVRVKPGRVSSPDWHDCVVEVDGLDATDERAVLQVQGGVQLHNVALRARLEVEGDSELANVWVGQAAGLDRGYAVPVLSSDPDMQQAHNHKALAFGAGRVRVARMTLQNDDDCLQLGRRVDFQMHDSVVRLVDPYLGDHRDAIDADDCAQVWLDNVELRGSGNAALFAKQEPGSGSSLDLLHLQRCTVLNQFDAEPGKRQGHMVWLGVGVRRVELVDNEWDARPVQTLLLAHGTPSVTQHGNVYANGAPALSKRGQARKAGQLIDVTYFAGV